MPKKDENWLDEMRHTGAHVLAHAVLNIYGKQVKFGIGPTIDSGFYYDFKFPKAISEKELPKIEKEMKKLIKQNLPVEKVELTEEEAKKILEEGKQDYKLELLQEIETGKRKQIKGTKKGLVSFYQIGEFIDLCKGGHLKSTGEVPANAFRLTHLAGAYWKGDENREQLTRIYAAAFKNKKELDEYLTMQKEAKKRDHRKLGKELDLFRFSELIGPGLPLWTPKGEIIKNTLDSFIWHLRKKHGYVRVDIPHITKKDLFVKSGHWDKFKDELFRIKSREGEEFALKPMNCPFHTQIYDRKIWSYKELPQRYANTTIQYRDEQTGELSGLARVRAITIDDAHVFCRYSQIEEEVVKIWDIANEFYRTCGFENLSVRLSLHDPKQPKQYLGDKKVWKKAEDILRKISKKKKMKAKEEVGEAAFYGPKIDFVASDSLGREWQVATIQLDMNLPERFDLTCVDEKGEDERIVMIHAAIAGSFERFLAVYIEHTAGAFPVWLAPVQAVVLSISEEVNDYAEKVKSELLAANPTLRIELDDRNETISKKIREAEKQKIPYMLIIGKKEVKQKAVSVRQRGEKDLGGMKLDKFLKRIEKEIDEKK